jgi:putative ABC transport system permease protein
MGQVLLVSRLAVKDIRHRPIQAFLLLLAIAAGTATLTLGLTLKGTTDNPYATTRAATNGPDVVASVFPRPGGPRPAASASARPVPRGGPGPGSGPGQPADVSGLVPLEHAPGVTAHSGPFPLTWALLRVGNTTASAEVEGRPATLSSVDRPKLLQGSWVRPGGVVVEAAFADALGLHVGDRLTLGGKSFEVTGTAVTAAISDYPNACADIGCFLVNTIGSHSPGLVWTPSSDVQPIAQAGSEPVVSVLNLKLSDPAGAPAFASRYHASASPSGVSMTPWQDIRAGDAQQIVKMQTVLTVGSSLLALLAVASVAVLVGGRMAEQTRRVGLLKAVGGTPRLVAAVLLCEHVLVGLCAAGVGLAAGWLAAPLIDGPGAGLLGAASAPSLSAATIVLVVVLALGVAIVATFVPAIRAARQSTAGALEDSARAPGRRPAVIRLSAHLPAPLLVGVRLTVRRPRRLVLSVFSTAVTASGLVAILVLRATAAAVTVGPRVIQATTIISVMLVILATVNAVFIAWATALDARHPAALARALGATPAQITTGLSVAQLLPALAGALLGIPGGIVIYDAPKNGPGPTVLPSALSLAVMVAGILLAVAVLTAIPARLGARHPAAETLGSETA